MIPQNAITAWKRMVPWRSELQVEQDLILHGMIQAIYENSFLSDRLAFRGGTCLNKLFWATPARYSEDLDFVQIAGERIGPTTDEIRKTLSRLFEDEPQWEKRRNAFRFLYSFVPENNPDHRQRIKVEINTREHFALDGYRKRSISLDSVWRSGKAEVTTFSAEELLATKLRALYQRRKGRDLFDLWKSQELKPDCAKVVKLSIEYFHRSGKTICRDLFLKNFEEKLKDPRFLQDTEPLIVTGTGYNIERAADFVRRELISLMPAKK